MYNVGYISDNSRCIVHVELGEELDYMDLREIRQDVRKLCAGCTRYIAIYDYHKKPHFHNFSLTPYRKMTSLQLDIVINVGMNLVDRSFTRLVHSIKPVSREVYFADSMEDAVALAKTFLPEQFPDNDSATC